ncbi:MAG: Mur ligase domain-containing protein, partial [Candidatus Symbiothrix sp.]|nr:Mur ligase domain-containing protein [Candidatus Symbiothrix sp.]
MKLQDLLKNIAPISVAGNLETEIAGIHFDSRKIRQGWLFVAVKGTQSDGHDYVAKAVEAGAAAVV